MYEDYFDFDDDANEERQMYQRKDMNTDDLPYDYRGECDCVW